MTDIDTKKLLEWINATSSFFGALGFVCGSASMLAFFRKELGAGVGFATLAVSLLCGSYKLWSYFQ